MNTVLEVTNVSKVFHGYGGEWRRVLSWFGLPFRPKEEFRALDNISFQAHAGESIGIIGQNGAGKSTLLKIISGTLQPSEGNVHIHGKIAAILELGMGFHPDLTGRQNALHAASLMGHSQDQIDSVMDDIEAFADIGEYFDRSVRTYSSGMQMRVAFSVATAFRPDILIVDEALSVGDTYFQHKSFDRIRKFQQQGTSLLLVSHDRSAIQAICSHAMLIEKGQLLKEGSPKEITDYYNAIISELDSSSIQQTKQKDGRVQTVSGTGEASVESILLLNCNNQPVEVIDVGEPATLQIDVQVNKDIKHLVLGYMIRDRLGQTIYGTNTHHTATAIKQVSSGIRIRYQIKFLANIGPGDYSISTALVNSDTHLDANYEWKDLALVFTVKNLSRTVFIGNTWLEPTIETSIL
ncbi:MAG: ABC transporter ATP-binding protein [Sedimenticola sp.]